MDFVHEAGPSRVIFANEARLGVGAELDRLGIARAIVITTPPEADIAAEFARLIGERAGIVYPGAQLNAPTNVTEAALTAVSSVQADGILAVGDETAIGLGKAIALRTDLPQVVVPSTFSGAEVKPVLAETERRIRVIQHSVKLLPEIVIYDPEFVAMQPPSISGPSAMSAIAQSVEALYAGDTNPLTSLMAEEAIRLVAGALPRFLGDKDDATAWTDALCGAWLSGGASGAVGSAIHDVACHTLAVAFDLDQTDLRCVMAPYTAAFNRDAAPEAMRRVARALGADDGPAALHDLMLKAATSTSLKQMGLTKAALEKATDRIVQYPCDNPRPVTRDDILAMLVAAYEGERP
jgi:alcohol dehydrogenase class IV